MRWADESLLPWDWETARMGQENQLRDPMGAASEQVAPFVWSFFRIAAIAFDMINLWDDDQRHLHWLLDDLL
jgi:hypothetical protein